jgi:hypothetical protein
MAAKKKSVKTKRTVRTYRVHERLEQPVHNLVGYGALLLLALVVLVIVYSLQWFIVP